MARKVFVKCLRGSYLSKRRNSSTALATLYEPETRMWAWQSHTYGALSELCLERARIPRLCAPDEMLVRVHTASINPLDRAMIGGYGSRILSVLRGCQLEFPLIVGRDVWGEVIRAGNQANFAPGDRVWGVLPAHVPGSLATYTVLRRGWASSAPVKPENVALVFAGLSASAVLSAAGLCWGSPNASAGRSVLLVGVGGVGGAALQMLRHAGARVTVVCGSGSAGTAAEWGASAVLLRDDTNLATLVAEHGPYDVALDCAGLGGNAITALARDARTAVTLTSPLLSLTDQHGLLAGSAVAGLQLAQQQSPKTSVRWAYCMPNVNALETLRRLADTGLLKPRVAVVPWRRAGTALGDGRGPNGEQIVVDFGNDVD